MTKRRIRWGIVIAALALPATHATVAHAAGVEPAKATPAQREQAQARFLKGRDLYKAKNFEGALVELNASLDIIASPNTRLYVGRCLRDVGRTVAAYAEFGRAMVEAKELTRDDTRYEKAAQAASDERVALAPKLAFLDVRVVHPSDDTTLKIANDEVRRGGWAEPIPVLPGTATVVLDTPGRATVTQEVRLAAGDHKSITIDAAPGSENAGDVATPTVAASAPNGQPKYRPIVIAAGALAAAGLATFFVAGSMSNSTYSDLEKACGGRCPPGHEDDISAGRTQQTFANVGLVVFVLSAATSVTLFVLGTPKKASTAAASASITGARVTAGPSFVGLQGAF